jgi:pimeloyl-ACP methyl ester carboxylesterase
MVSGFQRVLIMRRQPGYTLAGLMIAAVCLLIVACSPGDDEQLPAEEPPAIPVETASGDVIRRSVPFITLRNKTGSPAASDYFGGERNSVHTGYCDVTWTPIPLLEPIANHMPFYIPSGKMTLESVVEVSGNDFWRKPAENPVIDHPLLYVHGYNIGFEKGCSRAALFQENLQLASRFLLFSWPSDDTVTNYTHDESDIYWSVAYIKNTLERLIQSFGAGRVDIVSHSMGTRGAVLALVRMSDQHSGDTHLLNNLVLIAADIDAGIFRQYLAVIRPLVRNITLYVSDNDNALSLSEDVHGYPRLGKTGEHLWGLEGIEIIDVSATGRRRASGHLYHLYNEAVISDLDRLLNKNTLAGNRAGLQQDAQMGPGYWKLLPPDTN